MTVKELMEVLAKYPKDYPVFVQDYHDNTYALDENDIDVLHSVEEVWIYLGL